jgi:1-acyl-sn-glycerol-3-phosphate acyltransferase
MPCIVVANHASYLDGVLLNGLLPTAFSFVIKREMSSVPLAGLLLRRLGAEFVERRGRAQGLGDARRLLRQASSGAALVFFPEGTFSPAVGLLHFHIGAFSAAVRANLPIVPIAIRGTRRCLSPGSFWPHPGRIEVEALAPILPHSATAAPTPSSAPAKPDSLAEAPAGDRHRATALRDRARAALLSALGEPDLSEC